MHLLRAIGLFLCHTFKSVRFCMHLSSTNDYRVDSFLNVVLDFKHRSLCSLYVCDDILLFGLVVGDWGHPPEKTARDWTCSCRDISFSEALLFESLSDFLLSH